MTSWLRDEYAELKGRVTKAQWARMRAKHLIKEPYCRECTKFGDITRGKVVDHEIPHRGNYELFMDENNLQTLCIPCHNVFKRKSELTNGTFGCDVNGWPIGPDHYWNSGNPEIKEIDHSPVRTLFNSKPKRK